MIIKPKDDQYYNLQNSRSSCHAEFNNNKILKHFHNIKEAENNFDFKILDIGCRSNAKVISEFIKKGYYKTYGIDIGERAELQWVNLPFSSNLKRYDIHDGIPFDISFDLITCSHTLEHCYDPQKVVNIIYNNLIDGGYYWSQVPISLDATPENHTPHYCHFENHEEHISFIKQFNFQVICDIMNDRESLILAKK